MLKLQESAGAVSQHARFVAGISLYVDNLDSVHAYIKHQASKNPSHDISVNVLYLVHHRGGDKSYTRAFGQRIVDEVSKTSGAPLLAVSFDARNHGERQIDPARNSSWNSNNDTHALDMVSAIDGTVEDLKVLVDYVPAALDLESLLTPQMQENDVQIKYNNIMSGYSLGAHVVIRFANKYPSVTCAINPNVGCSDMTTLLINRLKGTSNYDKKLFYSSYQELGLSDAEKKKYPEALHHKVSADDMQIFESFPFRAVKIFASFYDADPVVPSQISRLWLDMYMSSNSRSQVLYEEGSVHDVTENMLDKFALWLSENI